MSLTRLDRWVTVMPTVGSRQKFLADTGIVPRSLASDAASSAIELGQLEEAVELLEQGRAILWSQLRGYRHPLEELRDIDGELAHHFEYVSGELERLAMFSDAESMAIPLGSVPNPSVSYDRKMRRHRILSEERDTVVERIRQIDGFANFLQPIPFTTLQSAAADGPVILVNISEYRSDAIILRNAHRPESVCLPGASPDTLHRLFTQLYSALTRDRSKRILPVLQELWDVVVSPVIEN
jgi:hypothetical protein